MPQCFRPQNVIGARERVQSHKTSFSCAVMALSRHAWVWRVQCANTPLVKKLISPFPLFLLLPPAFFQGRSKSNTEFWAENNGSPLSRPPERAHPGSCAGE